MYVGVTVDKITLPVPFPSGQSGLEKPRGTAFHRLGTLDISVERESAATSSSTCFLSCSRKLASGSVERVFVSCLCSSGEDMFCSSKPEFSEPGVWGLFKSARFRKSQRDLI